MIETKGKKVSVMSAKPSDLQNILPPKVLDTTPKVNVTRGPSYNDAFAQFITSSSRPPEPPKVANALPSTTSIQPQLKPQAIQQVTPPPQVVSIVQKKQEAWTNNVLQQVQQKKLPASTTIQRVKTERIQPYVSNQQNEMTVQQNVQPGQQVFYTIRNAATIALNSPQQQQNLNLNGNGYQQSY